MPKVIVVLPAYNAEKILEKTFRDIPKGLVSEVILGYGGGRGGCALTFTTYKL